MPWVGDLWLKATVGPHARLLLAQAICTTVGFVSTSAEVISLKSQQKGRLRVRGDAGVIKGILVKHGLAFPLSYTS